MQQSEIMKTYFTHPDGSLEKLGKLSNISCWISGHTHYSYDLLSKEGVRLISNQMGYTSEAMFSYLLQLGWSSNNEDNYEYSKALELFTLEKINKSPSKFDIKKLNNILNILFSYC
mgnify:CR=1 FL=1